jgi:hypothetical protein
LPRSPSAAAITTPFPSFSAFGHPTPYNFETWRRLGDFFSNSSHFWKKGEEDENAVVDVAGRRLSQNHKWRKWRQMAF